MSRHSFTNEVIKFVTSHEGQWIDATRFEQFGRQAWRTRISNARKRLEASGRGTIKNRVISYRTIDSHNGMRHFKLSQYRYVSVSQPSLFREREPIEERA